MHRHVRITHRAPPQIAQKQGRHREVFQKHKNSTESAARERHAAPTRASGAAQGIQEEVSRAQKTPGNSIVAPLWVSPGALWVRSRCYFFGFGRPLDVGPVSVLFGVGRDVRSVHACACFVRIRLVKKDCLLRPSYGSQTSIKEARRA